MSRRPIFLLIGLFALGLLLGLGWRAFRSDRQQKELLLPEATNDSVFAVVGAGNNQAASSLVQSSSEAAKSASSAAWPDDHPTRLTAIETRISQERYPVGTAEIELTVVNHSNSELLYSEWFDFRRIEENGEAVRLTPREGSMVNPAELTESLVLQGGGSVTLTVPIDLFDPPLGPGVYRVAQLACYGDSGDNALACTEISAEFTLE